MNKSQLMNLNGSDYSFIQDDDAVNVPHHFVSEEVFDPGDEILELIFAPDPLTGFPASDLGLLVRRRQADEVYTYIQEKLMQPIPQVIGAPDADTALDMPISRTAVYGEEYRQQLREIGEYMKSLDKDYQEEVSKRKASKSSKTTEAV